MIVPKFTHEGTTYNFEPPIDTGSHTPQNLAELTAIAQKGPEATAEELLAERLVVHLVLTHTEGDQVSTLNTLLRDKHQATIAQQ